MTRIFVYETTSADPGCTDPELQAQGRSMRAAMVADLAIIDGVQVSCAVVEGGVNGLTEACRENGPRHLIHASLHALRVRPVPRPATDAPVDFLRRQAAMHDLVWVVAPETGDMLGGLCAVVPQNKWLGCSTRAITIATSKRATTSLLRAAGIPATEPLDREGLCTTRDKGSWVVKPDDGCGAAGARKHPDHRRALADYAGRRSRHEQAVMEPWIDGEPLSMSLLCGAGEVEVLAINRQAISFDESGFLHFDGATPDAVHGSRAETMDYLARRIVEAFPGLGGFVGVDVTWHPVRGPVVIEINPRVTCAYEGLSLRLGRNVAQQMLALHERTQGVASPQARRVLHH